MVAPRLLIHHTEWPICQGWEQIERILLALEGSERQCRGRAHLPNQTEEVVNVVPNSRIEAQFRRIID
jgi:hypothetical protein